jgi:hypothetical protein
MSEQGWREAFDRAQRTRTANVACIKWGTRYGPEWVNRLYGMVRRKVGLMQRGLGGGRSMPETANG